MICACFDPEENKKFEAEELQPDDMVWFGFNEFCFNAMSILTKQVS
jgi:hypothetical protein